jgi:hypothetical protein
MTCPEKWPPESSSQMEVMEFVYDPRKRTVMPSLGSYSYMWLFNNDIY